MCERHLVIPALIVLLLVLLLVLAKRLRRHAITEEERARAGTDQERQVCPLRRSPQFEQLPPRPVQIPSYASLLPSFDPSRGFVCHRVTGRSGPAGFRGHCARVSRAGGAAHTDDSRRGRGRREGCRPSAEQRFYQGFRDRRAECRHHRSDEEERRERNPTLDDLFFQGRRTKMHPRRSPRDASAGPERRLGLHRPGRTATSTPISTCWKARTACEVKLKDGREFQAKVVGTDEKTDVAVIKIGRGESAGRAVRRQRRGAGRPICLRDRRAVQARLHVSPTA